LESQSNNEKVWPVGIKVKTKTSWPQIDFGSKWKLATEKKRTQEKKKENAMSRGHTTD